MRALAFGCLFAGVVACSPYKSEPAEQTERLVVTIRLPGGAALPGPEDPPLPLPIGLAELEFDIEAQRADGSVDTSFQGFARMSSNPGSVVDIAGERASGRNVLLLDGVAQGQTIRIRDARGPTRLWAEDIGYHPADPSQPPACANGIDDDGDGDADFPLEAGCEFANDDTEQGGSYAAGVSKPIPFARPALADIQGLGSSSPYELESVEVEATVPLAELIVTRITADGFNVTDIAETRGYGHLFAFTFNAPEGMRVCDRITHLQGTAVEFFGFTELSFPSWELHAWRFPILDQNGAIVDYRDGPCKSPEPIVLNDAAAEDPATLEKVESAVVRIENFTIGKFFGPDIAGAQFGENSSNCDLDKSGFIDFATPGSDEAACANLCNANAECVEWTAYAARGNYRVVLEGGAKTLQVNTGAITGFDPVAMRGKTIRSLTGTFRNFSGGALNWTIETRCDADLVCDDPSQPACVEGPKEPVSSQIACVFPRTTYETEGND